MSIGLPFAISFNNRQLGGEVTPGPPDLSPSSPLWYGVEIDESNSSPDLTRIAGEDNDGYHATLPVQSLMKGCLLNDDGTVNYYLDPTDWTKRISGAASNLDGTDGQVMIEIPDYYRKVENPSAGVYQHKISLYAIEGFTKVNKTYIGAYKAVLERSTSKLCSVINTAVDYRGGDNTDYDSDPEKTLRGKPVTATNLVSFRTYARNRANNRWNVTLYSQRMLLYELFFIEYATLSAQKAVDVTLTSEGYKKGALGSGVTTLGGTWVTYNGTRPVIPIGTSNSLASGSGEVDLVHTALSTTFKVNRYRGIENPFGDLYELVDGINMYASAGGDLTTYVCNNPDKIASGTSTGYTEIGNLPAADGYISAMARDDNAIMIPSAAGGSASTYYCDHFHRLNDDNTWRVLLGSKDAGGGNDAGFAYMATHWPLVSTALHVGTRLSYIPETISKPTVVLTELSDTSVRITATVASGTVTGYIFEQSHDGGVTFTQIADQAGATYDKTGLTLNTYHYRVKAYNTLDTSLYSEIGEITINDSELGDGYTMAFYDANDTANITLDGTNVDAHKCKLGVGPDLTSASGSEPQMGSGEITCNGSQYIKSAAYSVAQPMTIYMKVKANSFTHADRLLHIGGAVVVQLNTSAYLAINAGGWITSNADASTGNWMIVRVILNGVNSSIQIDQDTAKTGNAGTGAGTIICIGANADGTQGGDIAYKGLIIRSGVDDTAKQAAIYNIINAL
jgi:hypothetical protein